MDTIAEQVEIIRRIAERGKELAEYNYQSSEDWDYSASQIFDSWVHLLDEIERLKVLIQD